MDDALLVALQERRQVAKVLDAAHNYRTRPVARHQSGPVELKRKLGLISSMAIWWLVVVVGELS